MRLRPHYSYLVNNKVLNGIKGLAIGIVKALPDEVYQLNDREYNCVTNLSPNL